MLEQKLPSTKEPSYIEFENEDLQIIRYEGASSMYDPPYKLFEHQNYNYQITIQQAKLALTNGKSVDILDGFDNKLFNIKFKIRPAVTQTARQVTFDLNRSLIARISSKYIVQIMLDLLSPTKMSNFNYGLRVFAVDARYLDVINTHIKQQILPYKNFPNAFHFLNLAHILFPGLNNDELCLALSGYHLHLQAAITYKGVAYHDLGQLLTAINIRKKIHGMSSDLPAINSAVIRTWNEWENLILLVGESMMVWMQQIDIDRDRMVNYDMKKPFIDVRFYIHTPNFYMRLL